MAIGLCAMRLPMGEGTNKPGAVRMTPTTKHTPIVFVFLTLCVCFSVSSTKSTMPTPTPTPTAWPLQFHSILFMNYSGALEIIDLWYDWSNGRNFNIMQDQLGEIVYDLEWNNGTSFVYTLDAPKRCWTAQLEVGILRPNWLDGANYLGQEKVDGFLCNVWEKVDFIWYYEDVATKRPVHWRFYTGRTAHVMTFEVGAVLEDAKWQGPEYCFLNKSTHFDATLGKAEIGHSMRPDGIPRASITMSLSI